MISSIHVYLMLDVHNQVKVLNIIDTSAKTFKKKETRKTVKNKRDTLSIQFVIIKR